MEAAWMLVIAVAVVFVGGLATYLIAVLLPVASMERAQHNGRFAGLGGREAKPGGGSRRRARQARPIGYAAVRFQ